MHGKKYKLPVWMGSLDKVKDEQAVLDRWIEKFPGAVSLSDKLDGVSGLLVVNNKKISLYTRGNGREGQNISNIMQYINGIPKIETNIIVRGELIMSKTNYEKSGRTSPPRNVVAGLVNAKTLKTEELALVDFVAYELIEPDNQSSSQQMNILKKNFKVVNNKRFETLDLDILSEYLEKQRKESEYEIDGIVVYHDQVHKRSTSGNPDSGFAYKTLTDLDTAIVTVINVEWNLSKDGVYKPTVIFEPTVLNGAELKRATGFNGKFIKDNKIGEGSKLNIVRSGDVIPYIYEVVSPSENVVFPEHYKWSETEVDILCTELYNPEVELKQLIRFFQKIETRGFSIATITKLFNEGYTTVKEIVDITEDELLEIDGIKIKSAQNIRKAIDSKINNIDLVTLMVASNKFGSGFGDKRFALILKNIAVVADRYIPTEEEIIDIEGFQVKTAERFVERLGEFWDFVDENELTYKYEAVPEPTGGRYTGQVFIFTGFRNKALEEQIKEEGGVISGSITSKVTTVIAKDPEEKSGKLKKARALNIPIVSVEDF